MSGYRYLGRDASDRHEIWRDDDPDRTLPLLVVIFLGGSTCQTKKGEGIGLGTYEKPFVHKYLKNGKSEHYRRNTCRMVKWGRQRRVVSARNVATLSPL